MHTPFGRWHKREADSAQSIPCCISVEDAVEESADGASGADGARSRWGSEDDAGDKTTLLCVSELSSASEALSDEIETVGEPDVQGLSIAADDVDGSIVAAPAPVML